MLFRAAIFTGLFCAPAAALAGPWPDSTGGTFLTFTEDFGQDGTQGTTSLFVENGGRERFTIGIDSVVSDTSDDWTAYAFVRQPLSNEGARDQVAISAGVGAQQTEDGTEPLLVLGGVWGRDVDNGVSGWLSLEGEARYGTETGETAFLGGATVGFETSERIALVNQINVTDTSGGIGARETATQLTSSIVGTVSETARIELGATVDLSGETSPGLRIGTWLEF